MDQMHISKLQLKSEINFENNKYELTEHTSLKFAINP